MDWGWLDWLAVAALGAIVGGSELVSRYRDAPEAALRTWPAILYIAINALASTGALALIRAYGWFAESHWTQILMAGVSAMAFFREESARFRSPFRREADHRSALNPITVPD